MAKDSLAKASTPEPFSRSETSNWVARAGGLPAYIQHIAHDLVEKRGKSESEAIKLAIGIVKRWARGGGKVDANTRAAAAKAVAEWEAMKAKSKAGKLRESAEPFDVDALDAYELSADEETVADEIDPPDLLESPLALTIDTGDLSLLEVPAGAQLSARAKTARQGQERKGRGGKDPSFESKHPRDRGGNWTIKKGAKGDDVRTVQRRVGAKADGDFGGMTKQAVMDFQRKHGLQVDGVVGHQTATALAGHYDAAKTAKVGALKGSDRAKLTALRKSTPKAPKTSKTKSSVNRQKGNPRKGETFTATTNAKGQKVHRYTKGGKTREVVLRESAPVGALALTLGEDLRLVEVVDPNTIHEEADLVLVETVGGHGTVMDLALVEAAANDVVQFNSDGTIDFVIIRPCHGRGIANAIYESAMLERDAQVFTGWPVYDNHESELAKRARRGIPRPPSELAGEIRESFWDPTFTTPEDSKMGYETGAVIGSFMLTEDMEKLVRRLPRSVKTSVNAQATGKKPVRRNGRMGMLVEGIVNDPENCSVDLVTKAGAGGQVASLYRAIAA